MSQKAIYCGDRNHEGAYHGAGRLSIPNNFDYAGEFENGKFNG